MSVRIRVIQKAKQHNIGSGLLWPPVLGTKLHWFGKVFWQNFPALNEA